MKLKTVRSLLLLSLALILVIGGTTMAWFTAEYNLPSAAEMVVGTLEFEITGMSVLSEDGGEPENQGEGAVLEWEAGNCKEFHWTFRNTGSKTAFFRAKPDCELTRYVPGKTETAWGDEYRFVDKEKGRWARYFTHNSGGITETILLAGQNYNAGTVKVWEENEKLYVSYNTSPGWYLTETHLGIARNKEGLLKKGKDLPSPGQLPYKNKHNMEQSFTYEIDLPNYSPIYLAAHAKLARGSEIVEDGCQITWSLPEGSAWKEGQDAHGKFDGCYYYCQPVRSGEEITLELIGCLAEDSQGGTCELELQVETVQASHGAASAEWPGWPGS